MSTLRLMDGRMYEARVTANDLFDIITNGGVQVNTWLYLEVRQPGRTGARYRGLALPLEMIASIEDAGLGYAREES